MVPLSNMYQYLSNIPYIYIYIYIQYIPHIYIPIFPIYLSNTCTIAVQVHVLVFRSITLPNPLLLFLTIFCRAVYVHVPSMSGCSVLVFQAVLWRQRETQTQWQNDSNTCIMSHVLDFGICNQRKLITINTCVLIPQNSNYIENLTIFQFGGIFLFLEGRWMSC